MCGRDDLERVLERVRRLLALAEDPAASENEATLAFERAQRLMHHHAIRKWMLEESDGRTARIVERRVVFDRGDPTNRYKVSLADIVARANRCRTFYSFRTARNHRSVIRSVTFCGIESDVRMTETLWTSMELRRALGWRRSLNEHSRETGYRPSPARWRNGYYVAFQERIEERLAVLNGELDGSASGRELVLARDRQLDEYMGRKEFSDEDPRLQSMHLSYEAGRYGRRDASDCPLGLTETPAANGSRLLEGGRDGRA